MTRRKPAKDLTDKGVAERLFPKAVRDAVKESVKEPKPRKKKKPDKPE